MYAAKSAIHTMAEYTTPPYASCSDRGGLVSYHLLGVRVFAELKQYFQFVSTHVKHAKQSKSFLFVMLTFSALATTFGPIVATCIVAR